MQVGMPGTLSGTPASRVEELQALIGRNTVARWCAGLMVRRITYDDPAYPSLTWLGGESAHHELLRGSLDSPGQEYWPRVWGARGLLHGWEPAIGAELAPSLVASLGDRHWRVREMASKVARRWAVGETADSLGDLVSDPVPRVRAAAARALGVVGEAEHAGALVAALDDDDETVRSSAGAALDELERRLDRRLRD